MSRFIKKKIGLLSVHFDLECCQYARMLSVVISLLKGIRVTSRFGDSNTAVHIRMHTHTKKKQQQQQHKVGQIFKNFRSLYFLKFFICLHGLFISGNLEEVVL